MVGGDVNQIGLIELDADTLSTSPFAACPSCLQAFYPIASVTSGTTLNIWKKHQAGLAGYNGKGLTPGTFAIRPGVRIMAFDAPSIHPLVLEPSAFTFNVNDVLEQVHS